MPKPPKTRSNRPAAQPHPQPQTLHQVQVSQFQGPLPPPSLLDDYDRISPGAARAIIDMAQQQAQHRQLMELEGQRADIAARDKQLVIENNRIQGILLNDRLGTVLGWTIAAVCTGAATWSMYADKPAAVTIAFISLPVASIINALRSNKNKNN